MGWGSKSKNGGSNEDVFSDPSSESKRRPFKTGHYYDGNMTTDARDRLSKEGSKGLAQNQGVIRTSAIPVSDSGGDVGQKVERLSIDKQGSHKHFKQ